MIQLHHYPSTASMAPHILLEELGEPFELVLVDRMRDQQKSPDFLRLNPNGLIPVLIDGDLVLYETAAICLHLCDTRPQAGLAPALGTHERAHFYKWMAWLTNTLQATLIVYGVLTLIAMEVTGCETAGMEITPEQFKRIEHCLPVQRGNVSLSNLQVVNAMLYVAEHGCKWRGLPKRFGNWHTIYTRMRRWTKAGVLDKMFEELQREQLVRVKIEAVSLDSTSIKVHPDGTGALKKTAHRPLASPEADGTPRFIWLPRMLERP